MTKYFFKFKKPIFGPFLQFWGQKKFFKEIGLSCPTSYGFLAFWQNQEKSNSNSNSKKTLRHMSLGKDVDPIS